VPSFHAAASSAPPPPDFGMIISGVFIVLIQQNIISWGPGCAEAKNRYPRILDRSANYKMRLDILGKYK
jgi:hypothetical protein